MKTSPNSFFWADLSGAQRARLMKRPALKQRAQLRSSTRKILREVRKNGDNALRAMTARWDGVELQGLEVSRAEIRQALRKVPASSRSAMERAFSNIETFHRAQLPTPIKVEVAPGLYCERRPVPIERVGFYVPGGTASLPSTVLMLGIPAQLAGCPSRELCSPPRKDGRLDSNVIVAAQLCGIERLFKVGGAQAIAAMAYGTESIGKVDKIFGPGNAMGDRGQVIRRLRPTGSLV